MKEQIFWGQSRCLSVGYISLDQRSSPQARSSLQSPIVWSTVLPVGLGLDAHATCSLPQTGPACCMQHTVALHTACGMWGWSGSQAACSTLPNPALQAGMQSHSVSLILPVNQLHTSYFPSEGWWVWYSYSRWSAHCSHTWAVLLISLKAHLIHQPIRQTSINNVHLIWEIVEVMKYCLEDFFMLLRAKLAT